MSYVTPYNGLLCAPFQGSKQVRLVAWGFFRMGYAHQQLGGWGMLPRKSWQKTPFFSKCKNGMPVSIEQSSGHMLLYADDAVMFVTGRAVNDVEPKLPCLEKAYHTGVQKIVWLSVCQNVT